MQHTYIVAGFIIYLYGAILAGGIFAYQAKWFSLPQMLTQGIRQGLPWIHHPGWWVNFFVINPIIIYSVWRYGNAWEPRFFLSFTCCFFALGVLVIYETASRSALPQSHFIEGRHTKAGYAQLAHGAVAASVFLHIFLLTPAVDWRLLAVASVGLTVLAFLAGVQGNLKISQPYWYPLRFTVTDVVIVMGTAAVTEAITLYKALF